ncbi:MAG: hypothetical protein N2663_02270 [Chlorobi bacterium]|nr:hypothetical protein [Chlorobiota bacterium]
MLDVLVDQILLHRGFYDESGSPRLTTGTIVFGVLLRSLLTVIAGFAIWHYAGVEISVPVSLALLWGYVVYPAYRQYVVYNEHTEHVHEELLCSRCRHFNASGQHCLLFDEHVRPDYIPCDGLDWDPL